LERGAAFSQLTIRSHASSVGGSEYHRIVANEMGKAK